MKMLRSKTSFLLIFFGGFFLTMLLLSGANGSAQTAVISAAGTSFPGTGVGNYAVVQVTGSRSHSCRVSQTPCLESNRNYNAQTKLKARTTVAAVYVEQSVTGQVTLDVPCGPGGNDLWAGYINFRVFGANFATALGSKAGCDGSISFSAAGAGLRTITGTDGRSYKPYILVADGVMLEGGANRERRYMERFSVNVPADIQGDVKVGVSPVGWPCSSSAYPISCPGARTADWLEPPLNSLYTSWVYSSFYGSPGETHVHTATFQSACAAEGILSLYDFDQAGQTVTISGGGRSIIHGATGNNQYKDIRDNLTANTIYTLRTSALPAIEAVQILPSAALLGDCGRSPPTGTITISCTPNGGRFFIKSLTASHPDGGNVTVALAVSRQGGTTNVSGTGTGDITVAPLPPDGLFIPNYDGAAETRTVSGTITDENGGTFPLNAEYICIPIAECEISTISVTAGQDFYIQVSLRNNTTTTIPVAGPATYTVYTPPPTTPILTGNGNPYTSTYLAYPQTIPAGGTMIVRSNTPLNISTTGLFGLRWDVTNYVGPNINMPAIGDCGSGGPGGPGGPGAIDVTSKPYVKFYGNDVFAGGSYGSTCTVAGSASARGNGLFGTPANHSTYTGAASELAIFAIGQIDGVLPGSEDTTRSSVTALSFANTAVGSGSKPFGGYFGNTLCADDYWAEKPTTITRLASPNITSDSYAGNPGAQRVDVSTLPSGVYQFSGQLHIFASGQVPAGKRVTLYVDGTTVIGNVAGATSIAYAPGPWATIDDIPLVKVVTRGNMYVDDNVTQIDGMYVAVQNPTTAPTPSGEIHTCSFFNAGLNLVYPSLNQSAVATHCGRNLTINGAFISKRVHLLRVAGNIGGYIPAQPTISAPTVTNLSDSGDISSMEAKWIGLQETPNYISEMENWGTCITNTGSGSRPKSSPYKPSENKFDKQFGLCDSTKMLFSYIDAGDGAWFKADAFGGWSSNSPSFNAGQFTPGGVGGSNSSKLDACTYNGNPLDRIWANVPVSNRDSNYPDANYDGRNQNVLWERNGTSAGAPFSQSNGYSLVRNKFNLTQAQYDSLQLSGSNLSLFVIADDWYRVYINGQEAVTQNNTVTATNTTFPAKTLLRVGDNIIAVQSVDKIRINSSPSIPGVDVGWGMCYNLSIINDGVVPGSPTESYTSSNIAEVFRFSPELYLALLSVGGGEGRFDALLTLPPAL